MMEQRENDGSPKPAGFSG